MRQINSFQYGTNEVIMQTIVRTGCEILEKTFGKMNPAGVYEEEYFAIHRKRIEHEINSAKHLDEKMVDTLVDIIDVECTERTIKG